MFGCHSTNGRVDIGTHQHGLGTDATYLSILPLLAGATSIPAVLLHTTTLAADAQTACAQMTKQQVPGLSTSCWAYAQLGACAYDQGAHFHAVVMQQMPWLPSRCPGCAHVSGSKDVKPSAAVAVQH
jgi:hypothetical protein